MPVLSVFSIFLALASALVWRAWRRLPEDRRSSPPMAAAACMTLFMMINAGAMIRSLHTEWVIAAEEERFAADGRVIPPPEKGALLLAQGVLISGLLAAIHRIHGMASKVDTARSQNALSWAWLSFRMLLEAVMTFVLVLAPLTAALAEGSLGGGPWAAPWRILKGTVLSWPILLLVVLPALGRLVYRLTLRRPHTPTKD